MANKMLNILNTMTALYLSAGGCAAESEECVINSSVKAHTGRTSSVYALCAAIWSQCYKLNL